MPSDSDYREKLAREQAWHRQPQKTGGPAAAILRHRWIYSPERIVFNYQFPRRQMIELAKRRLSGRIALVLDAPCGTGEDVPYLAEVGDALVGVDVSMEALAACPVIMRKAAADAARLPFPDSAFDLAAAPLFFHHMVRFGFLPFLRELRRVLKPGGGLLLLEPSVWYPLNAITRPVKWIFRNPYGEVEDEAPFRPGRMLADLRTAGFESVEIRAATFSHPVFPRAAARVVNRLTLPLLGLWPFSHLGWMTAYWGSKPKSGPVLAREGAG